VDCDVSDKNSFKNIVSVLPKNSDVYTSSLSRTIKTFNATVENGFTYRKHIIDCRLVEQDLGSYSGIKYNKLESLIKRKNVYDKNWLMSYSHKPPNGESFYQLCKRVTHFVDEILLKYSRKNIIIFSHGGPIRAAISYAVNYNTKKVIPIEIQNSKVSLIQYDRNKDGKLLFINK
jgi:broad specificity phosphatase PhoE